MKFALKSILLLLISLVSAQGISQSLQIQLGPDEIGENQAWTISVNVINDQLKTYSNFPDIDGLRKRGTSTQSQTSIVNGQVSSSHSVIMTYVPLKQGVITIPAFSMKINEQTINSPGKRVKIGAPVQTRDPFGR